MSMSAQARGAAGVIVDGGIRDGNILMGMDGTRRCSRATCRRSRSRGRTRIRAIEEPMAVARLADLARCASMPGDWLFGDMDGVVVIPAKNVEEVRSRRGDGRYRGPGARDPQRRRRHRRVRKIRAALMLTVSSIAHVAIRGRTSRTLDFYPASSASK